MAFTIKELEILSGIKAHTIRIWEQRYHFIKPSRTDTNIRTYSNEELKDLLTVALLNKYGYKISRIDSMHPEERRREALQLQDVNARNEQLVNELVACMIDLRINDFEKILNDHINAKGIADTITHIIFLFLNKVGILWQTSRINPAHEHIVSNIIRQKIIAAIEGLQLPQINTPLFLLVLPEDEHHELGLLFVQYLLKQKGIPQIYLGADVPYKDAQYLVRVKKPQVVYSHLTSHSSKLNLHKFLNAIVEDMEGEILISGSVIENYKKPLSSKVRLLRSLEEVSTYINSL